MPSYWVTVEVNAPNILEAIDTATANGASYVDACDDPPQGSTIVGRYLDDEDGLS